MLCCFSDFHLLSSQKLYRKGICDLCWKLSDSLFLWACRFLAEQVNLYWWAISLHIFLCPGKFLVSIPSSFLLSSFQADNTSSAVLWASPFEFCCQLHFLWIKCFKIPGSLEYKRINYVSTQQHLSLKLGISLFGISMAKIWLTARVKYSSKGCCNRSHLRSNLLKFRCSNIIF